MNVLAVDPGKMTGFAEYDGVDWRSWKLPYDEAMKEVHWKIGQNRDRDMFGRAPFDLVVFEDFVITGRTLQTGGSWKRGKELEFIGVGRYLAELYGVQFETQTPSDARSFGTDAKLRALGWYKTGPDHCNAASRHLLLALVRHKALDLAALAAELR